MREPARLPRRRPGEPFHADARAAGSRPYKTSPDPLRGSGFLPTSGYSPEWLAEPVSGLYLPNALSDSLELFRVVLPLSLAIVW